MLRSATERMEYRILGPLEVSAGGELLPLGPVKQRALLAILLLNPGKTVSRDRLIDELWGEGAPKTAPKAIQNYVSRLRKLLPPQTLLTRTPGYVVELAPGQLDLERFEQLVEDGRKTLASGESERSSALLREALELWRGPALAEFESEPFAQTEALRLEELRLSALEERIEADLSLGRHAELVGELESLVARYPLRERLRGQLMLTLYRSDRQAEALTAYQDARTTLVDELGIDPSRKLQDLEQAILRHEPSLEPELVPRPGSAEAASAAELEAARQLPRGSAREGREEQVGAFVGRQSELERLRTVLGDALSGRGQLVMLAGEPGIGKTRTAFELAAVAEERGARVLSGRCFEREGAPPYWPWVEAIRSFLITEEPDRLQTELGQGATPIAEMVPELRELLPGLEPSPTLPDPRQARFRLLDSTASFLKRVAERQPLVLVLDDLHAADAGTLMLLEFVAHELAEARILVIGTYRDVELARGHPLSQTLAELAREQLFERMSLRGLAADDVRRFIEFSIGLPPPEGLVRAVHSQTEGNPLFVSEVVRLLVQEGRLTSEAMEREADWSLGVPEGVREVIGRRLDRLSAECNETLRLASVIGREFALDQLEVLVEGLNEADLLDVIDEALSAYVAEELPEPGHYLFTHTLIQETLAGELSTTRRVRLHARIAEALEELYGDGAEAHAVELAHHFAEAETVLGTEKLVHYSRLAGEQALTAYAYEEAIAYFERALAAKEGQPADAEVAALLFGLGRAQFAVLGAHELGKAAVNMERAFDYYVEAADHDRAIEVAAHPVGPSWSLTQTEFGEIVKRALELVRPDSPEEGRLLITHGWFLNAVDANYDGARSALDRALAISERSGVAALGRSALAAAAQVEWTHLRLEQCLETSSRLIELATRASDERSRMVGSFPRSRVLTAAGQSREARLHAAATLEIAERLHDTWWLASAGSALTVLSALEGDWLGARHVSDLGLAGQPYDARLLGPRALVEYQVGEFQDGAAYIERMRETTERFSPPGPGGEHALAVAFIPLLGRISGLDERDQLAEALSEKLLALSRLIPVWRVSAQSGLALLAVQRQQAEVAESLYPALAGQRGTTIPFTVLSADRLLGLLAFTIGRIETAAVHFQDALAFCDRAGYRSEYAWTASDYAEALLGQAATGDRERAIALQDEALAIARELAMRPLLERVLTRRDILKS